MQKLLEVITFILENSPNGRSRNDLSKLIYYSDGVFFQKYAEIISEQKFIHLEDSPLPVELPQALLFLKENNLIELQPIFKTDKIEGFNIFSKSPYRNTLNRQEIRIIRKVLEMFKKVVKDENKIYPNLYENYVIAPLYSQIRFSKETLNTKIHFLKHKRLFNLSGRLFRVFFDD